MNHAFVDLWGWFNASRSQAYSAGDRARMRLSELHEQAWPLLERDPQRALAYIEEGIHLARQLDEPCWELFHEYWRLETYVFYLIDMRTAIRLGVELAVKARKPQ